MPILSEHLALRFVICSLYSGISLSLSLFDGQELIIRDIV